MKYNELGEKYCPRCNEYKNICEFNKHNQNKDGLKYCCDECQKKYNKNYRVLTDKNNKRKEQLINLRNQIINHYGPCACCSESNSRFLAIDHVNNDGKFDRENFGYIEYLKNIINLNFPNKYRILCHNCNTSLGLRGYCPHNRNFN